MIGGVAVADSAELSTRPENGSQGFPARCQIYTQIPADARESGMAWNQLLSFAACVEDTRTVVGTSDDIGKLVEDMAHALAPSLALYLQAIEKGPAPVQIRAAYHVGMAYLGLVTRARAAIKAPHDLTDEAAMAEFRDKHAKLEKLLAPALKACRMTFVVIVAAAKQDPSVAPDEMTRNIVLQAAQMLLLLPELPDEPENWT
jgi:hypothetical protein